VRDTESSIKIVRSSLVKPEQMTNQTCMLADGCVKIFKVAEMNIITLYYTGPIKAASIDMAIHELLIGNDYVKPIAGRVKEDESRPQCSSSYTGPIILENLCKTNILH